MRKLIITAVACATVSLLAACGNTPPSSEEKYESFDDPIVKATVVSVEEQDDQCVVMFAIGKYRGRSFRDSFAIEETDSSIAYRRPTQLRYCRSLKSGLTIPIEPFFGMYGGAASGYQTRYPSIDWEELGFSTFYIT